VERPADQTEAEFINSIVHTGSPNEYYVKTQGGAFISSPQQQLNTTNIDQTTP
jgi:hypothetical protein